ncbi:hypothetical protein R84B8_02166 [Treponema sp. R8-4-B8]
MDQIGLVSRITTATKNIDAGRKGFATRGKEQEGRILYEDGIAEAFSIFVESQTAADPQALILAEYAFITQELQLCDKSDKESISSLTRAIRFFDDAFLALQAVEDKQQYQGTEKTIPHDLKYRVKGFPKDSFHIAFNGHKTRIQNILKTPGLDPIEKDLLKQRLANLSTAQTAYLESQRKALAK